MTLIRGLLSWLLALYLIAVFLHWTIHPLAGTADGHVLFFDKPGENVFFHLLAVKTEISSMEPTGRLVFGGLQLFAAFCLLVCPIRKIGAIVSILICSCLVGVQLSGIVPVEIPLQVGGKQTDGGADFYLAFASLTAAILLLAVHPRKPR